MTRIIFYSLQVVKAAQIAASDTELEFCLQSLTYIAL